MVSDVTLRGIVDGLREHRLTIAFAESCTGGRLAADLTTIPGSSDVVAGSAVCYQVAAKRAVLGLDFVTEDNVVSTETVIPMARAARELFRADIGVATTGFLDGGSPIAYWCVDCPKMPQLDGRWPATMFDVVNFPHGNLRSLNREFLIHVVMGRLHVLITDFKHG